MTTYQFTAVIILINFTIMMSAPSPQLPGEEITESESARKKSRKRVKQLKIKKRKAKNNWSAPDIDVQLARDKTLIGLERGAIFIPAYTESRLEPEVLVFETDNKDVSVFGQPGHRILMEPGTYKVKIGSGNLSKRMEYQVAVEDGHTTILEPTWAGLVVEVINEDAEYIAREYEVYRMDRFNSYGKGYGLVEERLKDLKTWILPPGIYKITRSGSDYTAFKDYITVQLNKGQLTTVELVFDTEDNLISGGIKDLSSRTKVGNFWSFGFRLGGNAKFSNKIVDGNNQDEALSFLLDLKTKAKFDNTKYLGINEIRAKQDILWDENDFNLITDNLHIRSIWIRRLNNFIGPYISGKMITETFPDTKKIDPTDTLNVLNDQGDTVKYVTDTKFELKPFFSNLEFGEGIGVNIELLSFYTMEASFLIGGAARQPFTRHQYEFTNNEFKPKDKPISEFGIESTFISKIRLGSRFSVDIQAELFLKDGKPKEYKIEEFSTDFRLGIFRNFELGYLFEITDNETGSLKNRFDLSNNILFRFSL